MPQASHRFDGSPASCAVALLLVGLPLLGSAGCKSRPNAVRETFSTSDPWFTPVPDDEQPGGERVLSFTTLNPSLVMLVPEPRQSQAVDRLEDFRWVSLPAEEAEYLAGWNGPRHDLYLPRGAEPQGREGEIRVSQTPDGDVKVAFVAPPVSGTAKPPPVPMRRQPIVALLERPPRAVYVTYETTDQEGKPHHARQKPDVRVRGVND